MVYINYYSKVRNKINMSNEELDKEIAYNNNRIVTKQVPNNTIRVKPHILQAALEIEELITNFIINHPTTVKNVEGRYEFKELYSTFKIPKRRGGFREICAPDDELKALQTKVTRIISKKMKFLAHNAAHGFTRKRNCKTSLEVHQRNNSRWFLKLDIKDFFPNTSYNQILTAMDCVYPFCCFTSKQKKLLASLCVMNGVTPQGAPTSPIITNVTMLAEDVRITEYCKAHNLVYTRYADDILISSKINFNWEETQQHIQAILENYELKTEKTRYGSFNGRNWNLGLMYNNQNKITVGHAKKKLIKNLVHNYETKEEYRTHENYYHLLGLIGYCNYIEPTYFEDYLNRVKAIQPTL